MKDLYIRPASKEEIVTILSEHQIATKLSRPVLECVVSGQNYTLIVFRGYRLLVSYTSVGKKSDGVISVHIACPRDSIRASRVLANIGIGWLMTDRNIMAKKLVTAAPKGKIANFLLRLGFKKGTRGYYYV